MAVLDRDSLQLAAKQLQAHRDSTRAAALGGPDVPPILRPSAVLPEIDDPVAVDTEGSGLAVDDGARPSIVIVAWRDMFGLVTSYAFPFDQGPAGSAASPKGGAHGGGAVTRKFDARQGDLFTAMDAHTPGHGEGWLDENGNLVEAEWRWLMDWLARRPKLVMHNAKHDLHQLRAGHRVWRGGVDLVDNLHWDTMIAAKELWPLQLVNLETVSRINRVGNLGNPLELGHAGHELLLEAGSFDTARGDTSFAQLLQTRGASKKATGDVLQAWLSNHGLPRGRYDLAPWDIIGPYARSDGELTIRTYWAEQNEIERRNPSRQTDSEGDDQLETRYGGYRPGYCERQLEYAKVLYKMEVRGLPFDTSGCLQAAGDLQQQLAVMRAALPYDPRREADVRRYYFGSAKEGGLGLAPISVTDKTGKPQVTEEVLRILTADNVPFAAELMEYNKVSNALSMWYEAYPAMIGTDGRLRTDFKQLGTRSGRISVGRFQAQALPHDYKLDSSTALKGVASIRDLVGSAVPDGMQLWELDLAQAELRVAARKAKCASMLTMITNDEDLHGNTARELFKVDKGHPQWFEFRQVAKRSNFSLIFGVGAKTFKSTLRKQLGIDWPLDEVEVLVQRWNGLFPEFKRAIYQAQEVVERRQGTYGFGWVVLANGRRRWFQPWEESHKSFNQYVQASLAEMAIEWSLYTERTHPGVLILTVHDSQVLLLPQGADWVAHDIAEAGGRIGTQLFDVPFAAEAAPWNAH